MENFKTLMYSPTVKDFINEYEEIITFDWNIRKGSEKYRYNNIKYSNLGKNLKNKIKEKFNKNIKGYETISYADTLTFMYSLFNEYKLPNDIKIYVEFLIPFANKKRIDYLITFKNTILLLEFSYFYQKKKDEEDYEKEIDVYNRKLTQAMQYKTLLHNLINPKIKIIPYVILYGPDQDMKGNLLFSGNKTKIFELSELIKFLYKTDTDANDEISRLNIEDQ